MNTATRHKSLNRFFRDLPEGVRVEFKFRMSRNYVLPEWVYRKGYRPTTVGGKGDE